MPAFKSNPVRLTPERLSKLVLYTHNGDQTGAASADTTPTAHSSHRGRSLPVWLSCCDKSIPTLL